MPTPEEQQTNNTVPQADNNATPVVNPNLPTPPQHEERTPETHDDPDMQKWIAETKDLPNAYKRVKGSREEVEKHRTQVEQLQREQKVFQEELAKELHGLKEKDPVAFEKLFGPTKQEAEKAQEPASQPLDANAIARHVQAQNQLDRFYERNERYIKDENDWHRIQEVALGLMGKEDANGKPYTISTSLRDALMLRHPELVRDKAVMDHLMSQAKRASASEPGDVPSDGASDEGITEEHEALAREMGVKLTPETRKRIAEKSRKR